MNIIKSFQNAFDRMVEKEWDTVYVLVDLHGTIFRPCYKEEETYEFYPWARDVLQLLSAERSVKLILWTSTDRTYIHDYLKVLEYNDIHIDYVNHNPEVERSEDDPKQSSFAEKLYYNVGIDDKFGFDPENDWAELYEFFMNN